MTREYLPPGRRAKHYMPDVALFDIGLPRRNGYKACRRIREQTGGRKIFMIAVTGWGQDEDKRRTKKAGFDDLLVKPVDIAELRRLFTLICQRNSD